MAKVIEEDMKSQSLAVRYRPRKLDDLIGQEQVVSKLRGVFDSRKIPSAILLTGGTGLGKTTTARIIARYINCEKLNACGKCENCLMENNHPDFEELNIANSRGIDDLRTIIMKARNRPRLGKFRVILLDEVHQLTPQAAEVMLKPLEEPPPQTLWILATTDPEKLKATIVNRCMKLHLLPIKRDLMVKRLEHIADKEGVKLKEKVYIRMAEGSGGHMRNAIALLENVAAAKAGGMTDTKHILEMIDQDSQQSSDKDLETMALNMCLAMLGLSLKSFWKIMTQLKGEEVALANKAVFLLTYLIEDGISGSGPFVWQTPVNRKFKGLVKTELSGKFVLESYTGLARATSALDSVVKVRNDLVINSGSPRSLLLSRFGGWIVEQKRAEGVVEDKPKPKKTKA